MADRVLVMHEGRLVADIPRDRADEESVMLAATGQEARHDAPSSTDRRRRRRRASRRRRATVHRLFVVRELGIALALVLLVAVTAVVNPRFLTAQSVKDLLLGSTILAILAVGQAIVVITRNVDLSVGSILGLSAFATGSAVRRRAGHCRSRWWCCVGHGARARCCGAVNGGLIAAARVPALVVTLGTLYVFRGLGLHVGHRPADQRRRHAAGVPADGHATRCSACRCWRCSRWSCWWSPATTCAPTAAGGSCTRSAPIRTRPGCPASRSAGGCSPRSSPAARWPVWPGCCYAARFGTLDANAGIGLGAQRGRGGVVGGVAIFGGSGSVYGAALGAVLLTTIGSALPVLGINPFWQDAAVGALILAAIGLDRALPSRVGRPSAGRKARG